MGQERGPPTRTRFHQTSRPRGPSPALPRRARGAAHRPRDACGVSAGRGYTGRTVPSTLQARAGVRSPRRPVPGRDLGRTALGAAPFGRGRPDAPYLRENAKAGRLRRTNLTHRAAMTAPAPAPRTHQACAEAAGPPLWGRATRADSVPATSFIQCAVVFLLMDGEESPIIVGHGGWAGSEVFPSPRTRGGES